MCGKNRILYAYQKPWATLVIFFLGNSVFQKAKVLSWLGNCPFLWPYFIHYLCELKFQTT